MDSVAEELQFGDITTGASNDLKHGPGRSRAMVTQWGMSEKLGPIRYGEHEEMMFLNRAFAEHRNYSDKVAQEIDEEVSRLVNDAHQRCHQVLKDNWEALSRVANRLLEIGTIDAAEFEALVRGETPVDTAEQKTRAREHPAPATPGRSGAQ